jgi:ribosomal protein S18 acetylase RimI-like enzyme
VSSLGIGPATVSYVRADETDTLSAVVALHRAHSQTLGFMPAGAFSEFAADRRLLTAAAADGVVIGYAAFDRSLNRIRLIHLCVRGAARGAGVARSLIERISDDHPQYAGIVVRCRADFEANHAWRPLGFVPVSEKAGRAKVPSRITVWWRSHGIPDLFSAIDHNVFIDLRIDRNRNGAEESQLLEADWLADLIRLVVTGETFTEIQRLPSQGGRDRQRAAAAGFPRLEHPPRELEGAANLLRGAVGSIAQDEESDLLHVASASAGGATVFVTRDASWINRVADAAWTALKIKVIRPSDVVAHLDALQDQESYRPAALRGTSYEVQDSASVSDLAPLINSAAGERRPTFSALTRANAGDPTMKRREVRDGNGGVAAAWALAAENAVLRVAFLRTAHLAISPTLARQIAFQLRLDARERRLSTICVTDPHPSRTVSVALAASGFVLRDGCWWAASLAVTDRRETVAALLPDDHPCRVMGSELLKPELDDWSQSFAERALWPAKALDGPLRSYVISIRPGWARELFSLDDTLWARDPLLGLSREHVYYRAPVNSPRAPARILWYASGRGRDRIGGIVACSYLDRVDTGDPAQLHERFRHLGVWQVQNIEAVAHKGVSEALRFLDTENFPRPVSFELIKELSRKRPIGSIQSPTLIDGGLFGALYREGTE